MNELTYLAVGKKEGLTGRTLNRYVEYMLYRWKDNEKLNCSTHYAKEWAGGFKQGTEYPCSDSEGVAVLKEIDKR
jgi:hypothetical protein